MIALKDGLPLVLSSTGVATGFRQAWLKAALRRAAARVGYRDWAVAQEVATSVSHYLERRYVHNVIAVIRLEEMVQTALRDLGYTEVARVFGFPEASRYQQLTLCL